MAKKRNPSFEILRVVAMFLIVVWHFLMHGVGQKPDGITSDLPSLFNLCSMEMIGCLAKVSTNCYILITGYFIIHQTSPKWEKIPKTWAPIVFYSVLLFFVFLLCSNLRLGWDDFGKSLMPIYFNPLLVCHPLCGACGIGSVPRHRCAGVDTPAVSCDARSDGGD